MASCSSDNDAAQRADVLRRLYTAICLCGAFLIIEVIGGYLSGSLAVLSDAAHLFSDLASFGIAIVATKLAALPSTDQHTFGLKRSESLAALFSMLSLAIVSIWLVIEAVRRLYSNEGRVDGKLMSGIAFIGVLVNVALAMVLGVEHHVHMPGADHGHDHDHGACGGHDAEKGHDHHDSDAGHDHENAHDHHGCDGHDHENAHDHHGCDGHDAEIAHDHHGCDGHDHEDSHDHQDEHESGHDHHCDHENHGGHDHSHTHTTETTKLTGNNSHGHYEAVQSDEVLPEKPALRNVNLHAAYLHVLGDLAQSVAVLIAGLVIWVRPDWRIVDPICTLLFSAIVFHSTLGVLRSSVSVLLEEVPPNINWSDMFEAIQSVEGVESVHELHIWSISHGIPSLSVHCSTLGDPQKVLEHIYCVVKKQGVQHATIQVQANGLECVTCHGHPGCGQMIVSGQKAV